MASALFISLFESFNIASVVYFVKVLNKIEFNFKFVYLLIFFLISYLNLNIFVKNSKFEKLLENMGNRFKAGWKNSFFITGIWSYFIISFLLLAFAVLTDAVVGDFRIVFRFLEQRVNY